MKSFNQFLVEQNQGSTHAQISASLEELLQTVQTTGRGGSLTIKVKVAPTSKTESTGVTAVGITTDFKLELPKPAQPTDFFYLTDEGETTRNHPKQQSLELREVARQDASAALKTATHG